MKTIVCIAAIFCPLAGWSQTPAPAQSMFEVEVDKPFKLLEIEENNDPVPTKKKKPKPKVFYGIKTKKGFTQKGYRENEVIEKFYLLKNPDKPSRLAYNIHWYDPLRKQVRVTQKFDPQKGRLLHGPYQKIRGGNVIVEGIFFKGAKHGRWMYYSKKGALEKKEKYYKGWPKESLITYYDPQNKTKIKEMIPIMNGERDGYYYYFHENGNLAVEGMYQWDNKVGDWVEYYPNGIRKKVVAYPENPFDRYVQAFVKAEWNAKGKTTYTKRKR